jgi:anti-sigma factor RsiW
MMTCRQVTEFLDRYLDGELPRMARLQFRLHLSVCRDCRRYLRSYQQTIRSAREAFIDATDHCGEPAMPEALVKAILAARTSSSDS